MSYHIVTIDSATAHLNCLKGQFVCTTDEGRHSIPLEDIAAIIVSCFSAKIELRLLTEAAKLGVGLILCETYTPAAIVLPAMRSSDTALTRAWQKASPETLAAIWSATVDAKCANQTILASAWNPHHPSIPQMKDALSRAFPVKEAIVSKLYWHAFRDHIDRPGFARRRDDGLSNHCLDYGYAVLLARVLQLCYACGLDPTFGVGHETAERATPLAYDLMEPFRPLVDARVADWLRRPDIPSELDKAAKQHILAFLESSVSYRKASHPFPFVLERVIRSFRAALLGNDPTLYAPWTAGNSKWAGC